MRLVQTGKRLIRKGLYVYKNEGFPVFCKRTARFLLSRLLTFGSRFSSGKSRYDQWIAIHEHGDVTAIRSEIDGLPYKPVMSIIIIVYNTDPVWLDKLLTSVRSQYYEHWELLLYDDGSTNPATRDFLKNRIPYDYRIRVHLGSAHAGISNTSSAALGLSSGEFAAFVDHDDELAPAALYEVAKVINEDPDTDIIFSDEDRITAARDGAAKRYEPFFKPGWDPILLLGSMYIGHLVVYRRGLVDMIGGFRSEFDYSQDYDLALRATEQTDRIRHIPKVLYHRRSIPESAASGGTALARATNIAALKAAMDRRGLTADIIAYPQYNRARLVLQNQPLISIIIPTDSRRNIIGCLNSLFGNTDYPAFEVIVVTNSTLADTLTDAYAGDRPVRVSRFDKPFNFSEKCNQGASEAGGDFLVFLNDDVHATHGSWLEDMLEICGHEHVGGVSPKMCYEDGSIQYAGMMTGVRGGVSTMFNGVPGESSEYFNLVQTPRCVSVLSAACLLIKRDVFLKVGGFDAVNTPTMDSDLDLSFKLLDLGYRLVYQPFASLKHLGHVSIKEIEHAQRHRQEVRRTTLYMLKRWGDRLSRDDHFTPNMTHLLHFDGDSGYMMLADRQEDNYLRTRNILFVNHEFSLTGAPLLAFSVARLLRKSGLFVAAMSPSRGPVVSLFARENIPVIIEPTLLGSMPVHILAAHFMQSFDAVIVNTVVHWRLVRALKTWNVPVIWFVQESVPMIREMWTADAPEIEETFSFADDIIIYGKLTGQGYYLNNINGNFHVLPFGAEPLRPPVTAGLRSGNFTILHVGTLDTRKRQDLLIKAVLDLPKQYSQCIDVKFIGRFVEKGYERIVKKLAHGNDRIVFLGEVPRQEIADHFHNCDVFVCTSKEETGPVVVAEAMCAGKAVISTRVGSVPEMIEQKESGILINVDDQEGLAEAIMFLFDNPAERRRLGRNAAQRFREHIAMEVFAEKFREIVQMRLDNRGAR